jgi:hypothetical protein
MARDRAATTAGEDRELTKEAARLIVEQIAPDELVLFDVTAEEYFADPRAALRVSKADEAIGFGIDLVMLTPYVLAAAGQVVQFLLTALCDAVAKESDAVVVERVHRLFHRRGGGNAAPDTTEGMPLEVVQEARQVALTTAKAVGLDEPTAALLADAIAGRLLVRPDSV